MSRQATRIRQKGSSKPVSCGAGIDFHVKMMAGEIGEPIVIKYVRPDAAGRESKTVGDVIWNLTTKNSRNTGEKQR